MSDLKEIAGVLIALIGLASALLAYKSKAREGALRAPSRAQVLMIDDQSIDTNYMNVRRTFRILMYFNVGLMVVLFAWGAIEDGWFGIWFALIYMVFFLPVFFMGKFMRTEPPSRVMRTARIKLKGSSSEVLQQALTALQSTGTEVARFDAVEHTIKGRLQRSVWVAACIIQVTVKPLTEDTAEIIVSSDAMMPSAVIDFGQNRKNVQRIVNYMLGNGESA